MKTTETAAVRRPTPVRTTDDRSTDGGRRRGVRLVRGTNSVVAVRFDRTRSRRFGRLRSSTDTL
ncbi:hypothetical protein C477_03774 [Haloterrigena salina JCM 13891]|uniref:Uncharacterized protein n=1 Tax=Haloterrigena salina JCM 13891 TaxID=1227488 RepID=M0CJT3_9EURY|nr:hypothetical protein C477_03774 [Haloterrigena salina JCM 13891]